MISFVAFLAVLAIVLIIVGKYAGKTIINAVRIGAFILAIISLIKNWDTTYEALEAFFNKAIPFLFESISQFLSWAISNSIEISDKALKNFIR